MKIESAEEFIRLCDSDDPAVYRLAATGEADDTVWFDLALRFPQAREAVIFNKNVPLSVLNVLSMDESARIRRFVAGKRKLSRELFERLARDDDAGVRSSIVGNPKAPLDVIDLLRDDSEVWLREKASKIFSDRVAKDSLDQQ